MILRIDMELWTMEWVEKDSCKLVLPKLLFYFGGVGRGRKEVGVLIVDTSERSWAFTQGGASSKAPTSTMDWIHVVHIQPTYEPLYFHLGSNLN